MNIFKNTPQSITKCWKTGFHIYKNTLGKAWHLALGFALFLFGYQTLGNLIISKWFSHSNFYISLTIEIIFIATIVLFFLFAQIFLLHLMSQLSTNKNISLRKSFTAACKKYWTITLGAFYFISSIIVFALVPIILLAILFLWMHIEKELIYAILAIVFIILSYYFLPRLLFYKPLILFDDHSAWQSIKKSWILTKGKIWRTIAVIFVPNIIISITVLVLFIISTLVTKHYGYYDNNYIQLIAPIIFMLIQILIFNFIATALLLTQFHDLKIRYTMKNLPKK